MIKLFKYFRGKSLVLLISAVVLIGLSSLFQIIQPMFLDWCINIVGGINSGVDIEINFIVTFTIKIANAWFAYWMVLVGMFSVAIISFGFGLFGYYICAKSSLLCTMNLRNEVYTKVLTYSFQNFNVISPASLITRLTNDAQKIQQALQMIFSTLIQMPIMLIGAAILIFTANVYFGVVGIAFMVLMILIVGLIARVVIPLFSRVQSAIDETSSVIRENVLGVRVVKSFNLQKVQYKKFSSSNDKLKSLNFRSNAWVGSIFAIIEFLIFTGITIVLLVAGYLISIGSTNIQPANIYAVVQTMIILLISFIMLMFAISFIIRARPSVNRIRELLVVEPAIKNIEKPVDFNKENFDIVFKNVNFTYEGKTDKRIIKKIDLVIKSGETIGIIGPTGSGKSTLVNLIPRLYDISDGKLTIGGVDIKNIDIHQLRENIGISLQEQVLFAGNIAYNLRYGKKDATEEEMLEACQLSCAWEFISRYENKFKTAVEQRGKNFSGGQKQRICLARTLIRKPRILILDDTTSALDVITEKKVEKNIADFLPKSTKIIVSQRISSIINADRIVVLDKGAISGIGTHDELLKNNQLYSSIAKLQIAGAEETHEN
ncbi:MAG: ABC transporter ATP-binding protein [Mycoplasma sp.]|nr:ABC transporter ATP-binding protein [Mycoplasma sp.]